MMYFKLLHCFNSCSCFHYLNFAYLVIFKTDWFDSHQFKKVGGFIF